MKLKFKRMGAYLLTFLMVANMISLTSSYAVPAPVQPKVPSSVDQELLMKEYIKVEGEPQCGQNPQSATYTGKFVAEVPVAKVMQPHENKMKSLGSTGAYPHGKDGRLKIAYIEYNVEFPDGVSLDESNIVTKNNSSMIGTIEKKIVDGKTVNFKFKLKDVNWQGIYDAYTKDKDKDDKNLKIEIPYIVTANSKDKAAEYDAAKITAKGDFTFYLTGWDAMLKSNAQVFETDEFSGTFAKGLEECFDPSGSGTTGEGTNPNPTADGENTSQPTVYKQENLPLQGDLRIGDDSSNVAVIKKSKGEDFGITGVLNVKPVKELMTKIQGQFGQGKDLEKIALSNLQSRFTAKITLPEGIEFSDEDLSVDQYVELSGENGVFSISGVDYNGLEKNITVEISLDNSTNGIQNFKQLSDKINSVSDELKVTVKPLKIKEDVQTDKNLKFVGELTGGMTADATYETKMMKFDLGWKATQSPEGKDVLASDDTTIILHLVAQNTPQQPQVFELNGDLKGDLLLDNDTEHDKVIEVKPNQKVTLTGALNVAPIKEQMEFIEKQKQVNPTQFGDIKLDGTNSEFTAVLTAPEGVKIPSNAQAELKGADNVFVVKETRVNGQAVTVTMKLKDGITDYQTLKDAIASVTEELKVNIKDVQITSSENGKKLVFKGELTGKMSALAELNSKKNQL